MIGQQEKISVIIPIYNGEKYLSRCLNSILNGNYENLEILCINDGSTDTSLSILWDFEKRDSRIKILTQENSGLSAARNAGLSAATGNYITFIDADDWIHPDYFTLLTSAVSADVDAVICGFQQVSEYYNDFPAYEAAEISAEALTLASNILFREKALEMFKVYACGVLYKREKIYMPFPLGVKVIEDNIFNLLNLPLYHQVRIINLPLYFYYVNNQSIMHTHGCTDAFQGLVWLCRWLQENPDIDQEQRILIVEFLYKRSFYYRYIFSNLGNVREAKEYLNIIFRSVREQDVCLPRSRKFVFRFFKESASAYALIKFLRGGRRNHVSSSAPVKLLTPSEKQTLHRYLLAPN